MSKLPIMAMSLLIAVSLYNVNLCHARYLPTRSQEDRLARLKELLQELLKSEDRNVQKRDPAVGGLYYGADDASADEGYALTYDVDPRLAHRLYRQQQFLKT